jgi:iron-sulfur cluster assembly accessory protein
MQIPPTATQRAFARLKEINDSGDGLEKSCLRIAVTGGGCSGFSYEISLIAEPEVDDIVLEDAGQVIAIDSISLPFLSGACIDYEDTLAMQRFVIENPNAASSCGCGTSFSI